jgi:hypothetical protein
MNSEIALSLGALVLSAASLAVATFKRRKPSLAAAVARGVAYGKAMGKTPGEALAHAVAAVQREDMGDNGKRDWPDSTIRFEVEALLHQGKK